MDFRREPGRTYAQGHEELMVSNPQAGSFFEAGKDRADGTRAYSAEGRGMWTSVISNCLLLAGLVDRWAACVFAGSFGRRLTN